MLELKISEKADLNYLAKIVKIDVIRPHSNADRLDVVIIDGNSVITQKGIQQGDIYLYFPPESAISEEFLSLTNSFRDTTLNVDKEKAGFFERTGRVRTMMLRKEPSMGYIVPISTLECLVGPSWEKLVNHVGEEFDTINGKKLVKKYKIVRTEGAPGTGKGRERKVKEDLMIPGQFKLHITTTHLKKMITQIEPDDIISISEKLHGTSVVAANVMVKKKLSWSQKLLKRLGVNIVDTEYKPIVSSRNVIKNLPSTNKNSYYESDIWTKATSPFLPLLQKGETVYAEIVGFLDTGKPIQGAQGNNWDYGCGDNSHCVYIYRITHTNVDGLSVELPMNMIQERAKQLGVQAVPLHYYGKAKELALFLDTDQHWHENFLNHIENKYVETGKCQMCRNNVEREGIVLRKESLIPQPYKMKQVSFVMKESQATDKGEVDIEADQQLEEIIEDAEA
jgi:hypothetical protein